LGLRVSSMARVILDKNVAISATFHCKCKGIDQ
jgi:hypothetical protein